MSLTETELKKIVQEELFNLINEEEIDEKLFDKLKSFGRGLLNKFNKPTPNASQGVGRSFARYQVPQKQPQEPEQQPSTALDKIRKGADWKPEPEIYDTEFTQAGYTIRDQPRLQRQKDLKQLAPYVQPVEPVAAANQLAPSDIQKPKMLNPPDQIITSSEYGETVSPNDTETVIRLLDKYKADLKVFNIPEMETQLVVGYLIANNRILSNTTKVPKAREVNNEEIVQEIIVPSYQQAELSFDTLEDYIRKMHFYFKKEKGLDIPLIHIHAIIKAIYSDGRLAISAQKLRRMPPKDNIQKESKSYKNFYNNWKNYNKSGVKI
jgi:hypothetical protein